MAPSSTSPPNQVITTSHYQPYLPHHISHYPILLFLPTLSTGTVLPQSRCAIVLSFRPQEEVVYNFNVLCDVKRKPNKLSLNIKGEGYAVHPLLQLETDEGSASAGLGFVTLRPSPAINYVDFGAVQVRQPAYQPTPSTHPANSSYQSTLSPPLTPSSLCPCACVQINDTVKRKITISNNGKYNFDYLWDNEAVGGGG